jgi:hypothetical protein
MGTYVNGVSVNLSLPTPGPPQDFDGDWEATGASAIHTTKASELVENRFADIGAATEEMLFILEQDMVNLNSIIAPLIIPNVTYDSQTIPDLSGNLPSPPVMSGSLDLVFPDFSAVLGALAAIPTVDLSGIDPADPPATIADSLSWIASSYDTTLFTPLLARIINDLQTGATGLDATVEQEIFDRARARQTIEFNKTQTEIEDYFAARGFELPPGAMAGRLQEQASEQARNLLDLNGKIMIEQAELAQKNSQFILGLAKDLEAVLRDFYNKTNDRSLDYAKALAVNAIAIYAENIKGYIAKAEADKIYIEIQIENLKATVEYNKGVILAFTGEVEAYTAEINGKASKNKAITDVYSAQVDGYESESRAVTEKQKGLVAEWELRVKNADADMQAQLGEIDAQVKAYSTEYGLREKVAEVLTNVHGQALASMYGAVNATAGISNSYNAGESESWNHSESRGIHIGHSESIGSSLGLSASLSNDLRESHDYKEK